jgi:alanyl-tRNA synthetase
MTANEIRTAFLDFFESKSHIIVPSAPMVLKDDPTLMFTNAGMNPFKDYFLGTKTAENKRVADTQKCLRVSGKHNDLEEVGLDTYHHTFFEMLGNWSFGDYFKKEAIAWAWELLTEVYKLDKDRLYVTVFGGDQADKLEEDTEAANIWEQYIAKDRILRASKKDNFWEMGDTGPCGPCSEIHIDLRPDDQRAQQNGKELVNQDDPLVVEIWNLVFIQFNRKADQSLEPLPEKHIDTGMGFERLCMAIQGKTSNYETDVFTPLIDKLAEDAGKIYGKDESTDIALRVIADHLRAVSFAIADGQLPSNNKAGYVIRRILRRAIRYGYTFLGFREPFINRLVPVLAGQFKGIFPELAEQQDFIAKVIREEENSFLRTLEKGLGLLEKVTTNLSGKEISGETVFELYDTYGFPQDLTELIAREKNLSIDHTGFEKAMQQQKARARAASVVEKDDWVILQEGDSTFVGYDNLEAEGKLLRYRIVKEKKKEFVQAVFDQTPFYAESGGQVGDKGNAQFGPETVQIFDTKKENDLIIHLMNKLPEDLNTSVELKVNAQRRKAITLNHTATHLLHAALKQVLGDHVAQKGSLVNDSLLRFDFSHFAKLTEEEIQEVEQIVNAKIRENIALDEKRSIPIEEAKAMGATALFGEKYGDQVRVVTFDETYSRELCGGCHVTSTGEIGFFKIISEGSVSAGVRRVEAITGQGFENYLAKTEFLLKEVAALLNNPKDLAKGLTGLIQERDQLSNTLSEIEQEKTKESRAKLEQMLQDNGAVKTAVTQIEAPSTEAVRQILFDLNQKHEKLAIVVGTVIKGKPQLAVYFDKDTVAEKGLNAGQMVRELAKNIKGGGGGQPFFATAGGKDANGLEKALEDAKGKFEEIFG